MLNLGGLNVGWDKSALGWAKFRGIGQMCFVLGWVEPLVVQSIVGFSEKSNQSRPLSPSVLHVSLFQYPELCNLFGETNCEKKGREGLLVP